MKIALIADTHFGARGGDQRFLDHQTVFLQETFFPYLQKEEIGHVMHLGDLVDNRKTISYQVLSWMKREFFEPLENIGMATFICGNHDSAFNSSNHINALKELLDQSRATIVDRDAEHYSDDILMVPWINPENEVAIWDTIQNSKAKFVLGHFDIQGFEMQKGRLSDKGYSIDDFSKFEHIFSGHYHIRSSRDNITYIGAPWQFNWGDLDEHRGFAIVETDTGVVEYINNPRSLYRSHVIGGGPIPSDFLGQFVRLYKGSLIDEKTFIKALKKVEAQNPFEVQIIDEQVAPAIFSEVGSGDTTIDIFRKTIKEAKFGIVSPPDVLELMEILYMEALSL